ncbi:uncharacterized protein LOC112341084 isoform X2 [Selaginella moellendorffii]|uniref:uncharacterized protein LOC112341084 isoform X2 n=1 Tax=Selaginella moellendorffii TaxID=88036 RepID=UPI000D1C9646|nr:uncharacterized protein LOC112341084 isoform X2 [Selaginella moellendorffii]|eukprot:XP_024516340.1 uncharacterized protein LOC112341084 isoform X2 [Selaginella moellendorffii]
MKLRIGQEHVRGSAIVCGVWVFRGNGTRGRMQLRRQTRSSGDASSAAERCSAPRVCPRPPVEMHPGGATECQSLWNVPLPPPLRDTFRPTKGVPNPRQPQRDVS